MSLVDVVDDVLDRLERDERLRFTLDGQLATVDDYLEIRPEAEERIRGLVQAGRLAIGPWQTLVDEFLVDGETIWRNLETGIARAEELGGTMRVGYLPDMFGHVAQMPQILRSFGIEIAVVWRGVPAVVDSHRFVWESYDGSSVVAEYLPAGYGNAAYLFQTDGDVPVEAFEERFRSWFGDDDVLGMVGTDHMPLVEDFTARVPAGVRVGTLAEYLADVAPNARSTWRGEMRSAARANLLPGVVSARMDLKAACARAERWLERYAEPLQALYGEHWPAPFLREAWERMFQNAAHDSICGCSADEVSAQVLVRYAEAEQIGRELAMRAVHRIAAKTPRDAFTIVNPSPHERADLVELEVVVPDTWADVALELPDGSQVPTQELSRQEPILWDTTLAGGDVPVAIARRLHGRELFGRYVRGYRIEDGRAVLEVGDTLDPDWFDTEQMLKDVSLATAEGQWNLRVVARPKRTVVDAPVKERSETVEDGLVRRVDLIHRTYVWDGKSVETQTRLEQRAHEPFLRVRIDFDNPCEDQRVRVHVPLREPADMTLAEGQFGIVDRGTEPEGGYGEVALATYPASAFVVAGGVALLLDHVTEYELLGDELALTVLRSTGLISRNDNRYREDPAGPSLPIPAAQMRGPWSFSFAYLPSIDDVLENAELYRLPFLTAEGTQRDGELSAHAGPMLAGHGVVLTALQPTFARLVNESPNDVSASFEGRTLHFGPWQIQTVARN